eukprot:1161140-Pelagomonas_calceolata.AAC.10
MQRQTVLCVRGSGCEHSKDRLCCVGRVVPASSEEAGSKIWMIVLEAQLGKAVLARGMTAASTAKTSSAKTACAVREV